MLITRLRDGFLVASRARPALPEHLDDLTLKGPQLERALHELAWVNRHLGGYTSLWRALKPLLYRAKGTQFRLLDLGSGLGDAACFLVESAARRGIRLHVTAIEGNRAAASAAQEWVNLTLPEPLRPRVEIRCQNVWDVDDVKQYDVTIASLFLHHFPPEAAAALLRKMDALSRLGIVVNDLHRHLVAYYGIRWIGWIRGASSIFRHDAPISVLRGYSRRELTELADYAGLRSTRVHWHWAFRWVLSTL